MLALTLMGITASCFLIGWVLSSYIIHKQCSKVEKLRQDAWLLALEAAKLQDGRKKIFFFSHKNVKKIEFGQRGSVNDDQVSLNRVWSYIPL